MAATQCFYEVLGVNQDATVAEIKKSYHTQALRYHPDKSGGDEEATEMFRRVQEAYEVLSNPLERRYYDDNRDELLNSDEEEDAERECNNEVPAQLDLYACMTRDAFVDFSAHEDGFFGVYSKVFRELDEQERTAANGDVRRPRFGGAGSDEDAVADFYAYWLSFSTCRSERAFAMHDKWDLDDAPNHLMRRLMQQRNREIRDKARKMFNEKVRRLAKWVQSNDPRSHGEACDAVDLSDASVPEEGKGLAAEEKGSFHCAACNKWYKNPQQLSNHEKSSKHKQTVAKVRSELALDADGERELKELEELGLGDEDDGLGAAAAADAPTEDEAARADAKGRGKGKKNKGRRLGLDHEDTGDRDLTAEDETDAAIELAVVSSALPSPGLVALQTRAAFEASEDYKKLNKTQRRKALQQWEAENQHIMEALKAEGKEAPPPKDPKEKKPDAPKKSDKTKVHGAGAHSREIKTPKKKKAVGFYGAKKGDAAIEGSESESD
eukprot:jgi/Chrpa1/279/Chrysochromulina_OHIO_Genome00001712-RA